MEDEVEISTRAPLNERLHHESNGNFNSCSAKRTFTSRVGRTFNLKGPNWVSVPGGRILTPDVPVRPYALAFGGKGMELNSSDRGEDEVQLR